MFEVQIVLVTSSKQQVWCASARCDLTWAASSRQPGLPSAIVTQTSNSKGATSRGGNGVMLVPAAMLASTTTAHLDPAPPCQQRL
jgi:hypothetical protein